MSRTLCVKQQTAGNSGLQMMMILMMMHHLHFDDERLKSAGNSGQKKHRKG